MNRTMFEVQNDRGNVISDTKLILEEQRKFYDKLYTSNRKIKFNLENVSGSKITYEDEQILKANITVEEL